MPSTTPRATSSAATAASPSSAIGERREPDREALDRPAAEPSLGRGGDPDDGLAVERRRVAEPDRQHPAGRGLAARRQRGRVALAGELAERDERLELAAGPPVELAERAVEGRLGGDRDDEDVRGDVPRLIGDDTKLHGVRSLRKAQPRDAGVRRSVTAGSGRQCSRAERRSGTVRGSRVRRSGAAVRGASSASASVARASSMAMTAPLIPPCPISAMIRTRPRVSGGSWARASASAVDAPRASPW